MTEVMVLMVDIVVWDNGVMVVTVLIVYMLVVLRNEGDSGDGFMVELVVGGRV